MRYEIIEFDRHLTEHPFITVRRIIDEALSSLKAKAEILFIENKDSKEFNTLKSRMQEEKHETLWTELWPEYRDHLMDEYVARYRHRIEVNGLERFLTGGGCIDVGCGNGGFLFASLEKGAASVAGIDFGKANIQHARSVAEALGFSDRAEFHVSTVYHLPFPDNSFDFGFQNGVFHHVDDQEGAIHELSRVMKPGGYIWYYVNGSGAIKTALFDAAVDILQDVPTRFVVDTFKAMNISQGKITHLTDGFNATYAKTTWEDLTTQLEHFGFTDFKRLVGGFPTDYDHDVVAADPYGPEKFGAGNLRLLARKSS